MNWFFNNALTLELTPSEAAQLRAFKAKLSPADAELFESEYQSVRKKPLLVFTAALLGGFFGIDRFMLGHFALGLVKLFTLGLFIFGWLYDVLLAPTNVNSVNLKIMRELYMRYAHEEQERVVGIKLTRM